MGKSSPSAPAPPDPAKTSAAQTASNEQTALYNFWLNNPNVYSPLGSQTFTQTGGGPQYDNAAYQSALNAWNTKNTSTSVPQWDSQGRNISAGSGASGGGSQGAMPTLDQFKTGDLPPTVRQDINLSPDAQAIYNQQIQQDKATGNIAQGYLGRIQNTLGQNLNTSGLPSLQGNVAQGQMQNSIQSPGQVQRGLDYSGLTGLPGADNLSADGQRVADAQYQKQTAYLDPQFQNSQKQQDAQLANQGIYQGSEAYKNASDEMARNKEFSYGQARDSAILAGGNEQSRLFGLGLQARQQGQNEANTQGAFANAAQQQGFDQSASQGAFANAAQAQQFQQGQQNATLSDQARQQGLQEQAYLRQLPLNEYNALRSSSQVQMPQFQGVNGATVANTNVAGNIQNAYQGQMNNYNQQVASQNQNMSNLFGLGGSLGAALITHSDIRLKRNIELIGKTPCGLNVYEYQYIWSDKKEAGVMAQEVEKLIPEAVITASNGFKMVNYAMVR